MSATVLWMQLAMIGRRLPARERGASLVEYALLIALIAAVCIVAVAFFGGETSATFTRVGDSVTAT